MKNLNRRYFIINSTKVIAGVGISLTFPSVPSIAEDYSFIESRCGEGKQKILIAYSSQFGTTAEMAEAMGQALCGTQLKVDVKWVNHVESLIGYDAVILGSAIQYDKWMPEASGFLKKYEIELSKMNVAYFFSCLTLSIKTDKAKAQASGYAKDLEQLNSRVKPVSIKGFDGVLDYSKIPFFQRQVARVIFAGLEVKEGDYRDWESIKSWSLSLVPQLIEENKTKQTV